MNTTALQKQDEKLKRIQTHKNYDIVSKKIRKLLSATAQTFIPELAEALAKDWYPQLSLEQIKNNKEARESIRDKIFEDWSKDQGPYSQDNIWSDITIRVRLPKWLKNPTQQMTTVQAREMAREAKIELKSSISEREKQKLENFATTLPDTVIIPEPKNKDVIDDEEWERMAPSSKYLEIGEKGKTVMEQVQEIRGGAFRLFSGLTEKTRFPSFHDEDLILDYIKPTREFRRSLVSEMDESQRIDMYNNLGAVDAVVQDMLEILEQNKSKKK